MKGWSAVLSINGLLVGAYMQAELWPSNHDPNLPKIIGTVMLIGLWCFNIFGLRPGVWLSYLLGILTMIPMLIIMFVPFLNGSLHSHNLLPLGLPGGVGWFTWAGCQSACRITHTCGIVVSSTTNGCVQPVVTQIQW